MPPILRRPGGPRQSGPDPGVMRAEGLEPPRLAAPAPKAGVSTNSTTPARAPSYVTSSAPTCSSSSATLSRCEIEMLRWLDCVQRRPSCSHVAQNRPRMSGRHVREEPARILVLGDATARQLGLEAVDGAAAVGVQQAAQEPPRMLLDDPLLPRLEHDRPLVLAAADRAAETPRTNLASSTRCGRSCELAMRANAHVPPQAGLDDRASALVDERGDTRRRTRSRAGLLARATHRRGTNQGDRHTTNRRAASMTRTHVRSRVGRNRLQCPPRGDWSNGYDDGLQNHRLRFDSLGPPLLRRWYGVSDSTSVTSGPSARCERVDACSDRPADIPHRDG